MKKLIILVVILCTALCLCACGGETATDDNKTSQSQPTESETTSEESIAKFTVTVVDQNGDPVPKVVLQLCKDICKPTLADENGVAIFNEEITDEHKLSLSVCPEGYETEYVGTNYIYLEEGITEYTFEITKK